MEISLYTLIFFYVLFIILIPGLGVILFYSEAIKKYSSDWVKILEKNEKNKK
jgi:hypothetical protein